MQNLYEPPNSDATAEVRKADPAEAVFLAANSGVLVIPALVFAYSYFIGGLQYVNMLLIFMIAVVCSLPASILITLFFRKIGYRWAAVAGAALSILFCLLLLVIDRLITRQ